MKKDSVVRSRWMPVLLHVLGWGLIFLLPLIGNSPQQFHHFPEQAPVVHFAWPFLFQNIFWVLFFYLNAFVLMPAFFRRAKMPLYVTSIAALLALYVFAERLTSHGPGRPVGMVVFPFLFVIGMSITFRILSDHFKNEKVRKEKETENLRSELAFLRSQISPHFIFNVLNNMVSLARKKSDLLEPTLIRLSSLLHYMLYESDDEKISLDREVEYIKDYVDLQRLRFGDRLQLETYFGLSALQTGYQVEPMLLIPFVENAFKHGAEVVEHPSIRITLLQEENEISFVVINKYATVRNDSPERHSGIGLGNVRRRLALLYPGRHTLNLSDTGDSYVITLHLKLA